MKENESDPVQNRKKNNLKTLNIGFHFFSIPPLFFILPRKTFIGKSKTLFSSGMKKNLIPKKASPKARAIHIRLNYYYTIFINYCKKRRNRSAKARNKWLLFCFP